MARTLAQKGARGRTEHGASLIVLLALNANEAELVVSSASFVLTITYLPP